ncbi:MAG: transcriptional regulator, family [Clostridia bacterium]|nr:transcriptional regulator, family [Clostridia bacterium]
MIILDLQDEMKKQINICMFGDFSITYNDKILTDFSAKSKKVISLIEFLIVNRNKNITQEKIYDILWEDDDKCDNPANALKNLVYRARILLCKLFNMENKEFILYKQNTYIWNNDIDCVVDVEEFECLLTKASDITISDDIRIDLFIKAFNLYKGEFLSKAASEYWVLTKSTYYASIYIKNIIEAAELILNQKRYEDLIHICEVAIEYYPFEEQIQILLIKAYAFSGKYQKALSHYDSITKLFYKELGVKVSDSLRNMYREISKYINNIEQDIDIISEDLKESGNVTGAYLCDYEIFKNLYRIQSRTISRTGQSIYIALMTINDTTGNEIDINILKTLMDLLQNTIVSSIRKGDIVSRYSLNQFIIMLPLAALENGETVLNRILMRFKKVNKIPKVKINTKLQVIEPKL